MKKGWTVATNCPELFNALTLAKCNGTHGHIMIQGDLTVLPGFYPPAMAWAVRAALQIWWGRLTAVSAKLRLDKERQARETAIAACATTEERLAEEEAGSIAEIVNRLELDGI